MTDTPFDHHLFDDALDDIRSEADDAAPTLLTILGAVDSIAEKAIVALIDKVDPESIGLDPRIRGIYVGKAQDFLVTDQHFSEYFSGFVYVDSDCVKTYGRFKVWSPDDSRVRGHLSHINSNFILDEEE